MNVRWYILIMELLSFSRILSKDSYYKHEVRLLDVDENGLHRKIWKLTGGKKVNRWCNGSPGWGGHSISLEPPLFCGFSQGHILWPNYFPRSNVVLSFSEAASINCFPSSISKPTITRSSLLSPYIIFSLSESFS